MNEKKTLREKYTYIMASWRLISEKKEKGQWLMEGLVSATLMLKNNKRHGPENGFHFHE